MMLQFIGAILLAGLRWLLVVGLTGIFLRRALRQGVRWRRLEIVLVLAEAGLNFVHDAQIADVFLGARLGKMKFPVRVVIEIRRLQIGQLRFAEGKTRSSEQDQEGCEYAGGAVGKFGSGEPGQEIAETLPAGNGFARANSFIENGIDEARRFFDLMSRVQFADEAADGGEQGRAIQARVGVGFKRGALGVLKQTVEIVAQAQFNLIASPGHDDLRTRKNNSSAAKAAKPARDFMSDLKLRPPLPAQRLSPTR